MKKHFKAIATDIDGTLLNKFGEVTKRTRESISYLTTTNILVFLCSARPAFAIYPIANSLNINTPLIACNGAQIVARNGNETLHESHISKYVAKDIIDAMKDLSLGINIYSDKKWYVDNITPQVEVESNLVNIIPVQINKWNEILKTIKILKILIFYNDAFYSELIDKLEAYKDYITIEVSKIGYLEILPFGSKKSKSLNITASIYDISAEEIIAIGDNYNDIDLFQYAGYSIALGNAPIEVQSAADWTSTSNDNEGFHNAINWIRMQKLMK